ncbi:sodium-dependent lysophosphatidylcholine symporter 1-B-like isoform X1 [Branchiostoma floridae]|uniref:Sodium-dependent lysophosphatidylcholine symporter 1-B-like isoform X1 n=1 Tax=Branchiostoma floridae TaxID=7739 RepID=A0A9J7L6M9_BRAFL|nr:sodium-dependent lysophosphatidylcholine symporter 1-B-like isoform X1 [Branchiostoma floridae]
MSAQYATVVVFISRTWDVVSNLIAGRLISSTNTRFGRMKPWIFWSGILLIPVYFLSWYVPPNLPDVVKMIYYLLLSSLFMFLQTANNVSYRTLVMYMSDDENARNRATLIRGAVELVAVVVGIALHGQIVAAYDTAPEKACRLANSTDNSTNHRIDPEELEDVVSMQLSKKNGYLISAGAMCGMSLLATLIVTLGVKERRDMERENEQNLNGNFLKTLKGVVTFRPNVYFLIYDVCLYSPTVIYSGGAAIYLQYSLDLRSQVPNILLITVVSTVVALPAVGVLVDKFGKKPVYIVMVALTIPFLTGCGLVPPGNLPVVIVIIVFMGALMSANSYIPWTMLSDIVDAYQLQTNQRLDTLFFSMYLLMCRLASVLGQAATTVALVIGGYVTGECTQPESVDTSLRILMSGLPVGLSLIGLVCLIKYPITEEIRKENKEALDEMTASLQEMKTPVASK